MVFEIWRGRELKRRLKTGEVKIEPFP
jgi:hypothetical protein